MKCEVCGVTPPDRPALVLLTHTLVGRKRTISWTICLACDRKERNG